MTGTLEIVWGRFNLRYVGNVERIETNVFPDDMIAEYEQRTANNILDMKARNLNRAKPRQIKYRSVS